MNAAAQRYLTRRACLDAWPLQGDVPDRVQCAVVIPALGEYPGLFDTLADLAANSEARRAETLVVVVVNNRSPEHAAAEDRAANRETLARLRARPVGDALHLAWVDAASPGCELAPKEGVGLARKIGMDHALAHLAPDGALVGLDADTRVDTGYLEAIGRHFAAPGAHAAVIAYAHPDSGNDAMVIADYERHLRAHELGLACAGSPYAYTAIGSAMACTARAYVQAGGMNRRQAGEDFYFLQQLAKAGRVDTIHDTVVRPSPRPSHRVPFGTGRRVGQVLAGNDAIRAYHPESYRILRAWLGVMAGAEDAMAAAAGIDPALRDFLEAQGYVAARENISRNAAQPEQRRIQLHRWFDAFRTLKLFHYLRDHGYPDPGLDAGIAALLQQMGLPEADTSLAYLRALCVEHWSVRGLFSGLARD